MRATINFIKYKVKIKAYRRGLDLGTTKLTIKRCSKLSKREFENGF